MAKRTKEAPFSVILDGAGKLEDVPLREVAAWLDGLVGLVARGSAAVLHRPLRSGGGRYEGPIEDASHVRLESLESGSIVANLLPAKSVVVPDALELTAESLSEQGMSLLLDVAAGHVEKAPELAEAFLEFYDRFVARHEGASLRLKDQRPDHRREVVVDTGRSQEIRAAAAPALSQGPITTKVIGRLFEANTETHSALLRAPSGAKVDVRWSPEHEPEIRRLLGGQANLRGDVTFDAKTNEVRSVRISEILTGDQLGLDFGGLDFWTDVPALQLVATLGATPVQDAADLEVSGVTDEEWSALYEAIDVAR